MDYSQGYLITKSSVAQHLDFSLMRNEAEKLDKSTQCSDYELINLCGFKIKFCGNLYGNKRLSIYLGV